jgi:hypothetical protein
MPMLGVLTLELDVPPNSPLIAACPCAAMTIPSGKQALLDAMEPQAGGTPPTFEKSKQLHPGRQVAHCPQTEPSGHGPQAQSTSLGTQLMVVLVSQTGGSDAGHAAPGAQVCPELEHADDWLVFTHW